MLQISDIKKYYTVGETTTKALDGVSVAFRKQEFVAILGPSGSGKTTMLNVIGGLDQYDSGDMVINGKSTQTFKDSDWDAYRNNSVGFVFQSYNLISHLGIIENVELGMTLSGVSKAEKLKKATEALTRVGLAQHMHKKPNQLSGGQMQRVAIARALANNPDILLCDEPTGALDTETSVQIMQLIHELSKEKLVIMVTHNPELAHEYADRIIEFSDGRIVGDSNPHIEGENKAEFTLIHTKMSFWTALKISFNNIRTKKGRTFLTAFASSIGIISIAVVLALSTGFQKQIDDTQAETMANYPITISQSATDLTKVRGDNDTSLGTTDGNYHKSSTLTAKMSNSDKAAHQNLITQDYLDYLNKIDPSLSKNIGYTKTVAMNLLRKVNGQVTSVQFSNQAPDKNSSSMASMMSSMTGSGISAYPTTLNGSDNDFVKENYNVLSGSYPKKATDIVLVVDSNNSTNINALKNLGITASENQKIKLSELVGTKIKLVANDDYYTKLPTGNFIPSSDLNALYNNQNNLELTISAVIRVKESSNLNLLSPGIAYSDGLTDEIVKANQKSAIVKAQNASQTNVMTNEKLDATNKKNLLTMLGANSMPNSIMIYPTNFKHKDQVLDYLDAYNKDKASKDKIIYTDLGGTMTKLTGGLMDAITYVLIAFAAISLITSMIMISIITYTSVIERTKEIGVLKALGARKKDVTRVFDAETFILGAFSGILGVIIAWIATFPINSVIYSLTDLVHVAELNPLHAIILVIVSTILTMLGGHIPARMAAKKDAAIALRAE